MLQNLFGLRYIKFFFILLKDQIRCPRNHYIRQPSNGNNSQLLVPYHFSYPLVGPKYTANLLFGRLSAGRTR